MTECSNILLVEDDEVDVMNVKRAFTKANIANPLFVAHDGVEALELLAQGQTCRRSAGSCCSTSTCRR